MYSRLLRTLLRFFAWWGGMFALLAGGSVCPCCGTPTCPGGAASAGLLAGVISVLLFVPRWLWRQVAAVRDRGNRPSELSAIKMSSEVVGATEK